MKKNQLHIGKSIINYYRIGKGDRLLIAFHGYGDQAQVFQAFEWELNDSYTIYAVDLPFHGSTEWSNDQFDKKAILSIIDALRVKAGKSSFDLLGHSFGGQIILALLNQIREEEGLERVFLLAPGGIKTRGMQLPLLIPDWVRRLLKMFFDDPRVVLNLVKGLKKIRVLDTHAHRFIMYHYTDEKRRKALWYTWFSMDAFTLKLYKIKEIVKKRGYRLHFILGKSDPLISQMVVSEWQQTIPNSSLHVLPGGHKLIKVETAKLIETIIDEP